ncbi:MAG: hypothetical protein AB7E52_08565 [Bdellovibrionales bacterium]
MPNFEQALTGGVLLDAVLRKDRMRAVTHEVSPRVLDFIEKLERNPMLAELVEKMAAHPKGDLKGVCLASSAPVKGAGYGHAVHPAAPKGKAFNPQCTK